jgi:hypothetical protein
VSEEEKNAATKPQRAGPLAAEALKAEEAKAPPKYRRRKVVEKKIEAASAKEGRVTKLAPCPAYRRANGAASPITEAGDSARQGIQGPAIVYITSGRAVIGGVLCIDVKLQHLHK